MTTRLSLMLAKNLHLSSGNALEKEVYPLRWRPALIESPPDISGLPLIDDALYLFNTVKHHLDQHYRFFDHETFIDHLHRFYSGNLLQESTENRLCFVLFLLVLAFGNAFLLRSRNNKDPPGDKFFLRTMALIFDETNLWTEGLLTVEIGQAIRIAQLDGLHTELPGHELRVETVTRCRYLWWTLYVMDRHVSSSLALPMTTHDSDITTLLKPADAGSRREPAPIYKNKKAKLGTFSEKTRTILQTMTLHARENEEIVQAKSSNSLETMPKGTQYITLLYHQCVIVAIRLLVLSVLKERLERLGCREDDWQSFLASTKALINTGIKSAFKTLQILADENSVLKVFLPFELEVMFGVALHLMMAETLLPHATQGQSYSHEVHSILDEMIFKRNRLATARKTELTHLETLFRELAARVERMACKP
ncbi:hypothetical protein BDW67DRAFT_186725 [Aspergillus spinulosporus]